MAEIKVMHISNVTIEQTRADRVDVTIVANIVACRLSVSIN